MQQCLLKSSNTSNTPTHSKTLSSVDAYISQDPLSHLDSVSPSPASLYIYEPSPTTLDCVWSLSLINKATGDLSSYNSPISRTPLAILAAKKKYKPVALKVRPIMAELPERFRIVRNILGNPLDTLPSLPKHPEPFRSVGRYTIKRKEYIDNADPGDFLWPVEQDLI